MTFQSDLTKAELYLQIDEANASLTALERSTRYQRRRYFAEINNSGNSSGAFEAFQELGVAPGAIDETTYNTNRAAFESALAVCVADGATPTQAHVTAANSAWTTFAAGLI